MMKNIKNIVCLSVIAIMTACGVSDEITPVTDVKEHTTHGGEAGFGGGGHPGRGKVITIGKIGNPTRATNGGEAGTSGVAGSKQIDAGQGGIDSAGMAGTAGTSGGGSAGGGAAGAGTGGTSAGSGGSSGSAGSSHGGGEAGANGGGSAGASGGTTGGNVGSAGKSGAAGGSGAGGVASKSGAGGTNTGGIDQGGAGGNAGAGSSASGSGGVCANVSYKGVSLAGAEFAVDSSGNGPLPGTFGVHYMYPDASYAQGYTSPGYFLGKGMTTFRLPFRWERLQPKRNAPFDAAEMARLTTTVDHLTAMGATVVLDPHNYARYGADLIGSTAVTHADFVDLWSRLALAFKGNAKVIFGLMNEPHDMPTEQWVDAANAAIIAIRGTAATNLVLVPGNGWTGASSWSDSWYGTPNATAMLAIKDSANNMAFEAHQYLDADGGGGSQHCVSATIGSQRLSGFTSWLRANGKKGFLGEFGASSETTCLSAIDDMLTHVEKNSDVWLGWTYWAGGPWWGNHWMMVEPVGGADTKQMSALLPHLNTNICADTKTIRIMPLGDSITLGVNGGYRNGLWNRLVTAGRTIDFVGSQSDPYTKISDHDHEGHPGFTIGNIFDATDTWLKNAKPTHVLLMAGTNDIAWWCAQSAGQVADANGVLIDKILADIPNVWVIVGSSPPLTSGIIQPNNVDRAQLIIDYNIELKKRVQTRINAGKQVRVADVASVLTTTDLYDGVHPTEVAADKIAQIWFDTLTPILP